MNQTANRGKINIVGCGGAGSNLTTRVEALTAKQFDGFADISTHYVDTSRSNMSSGIPEEKFHLIEGKDGSGAIRKENSNEIRDSAPAIAHKISGVDLVILICSGGGGTGSVIAPLLARALMDKDQPFIVFVIGSAESVTYATNTLRTIESFDGAVQMKQKPITMAYFQNSQSNRRADVDERVFNIISVLATLFSRQNKEMDTQDLRNWLRFDRVTSNEPQLSVLNMIGCAQEHSIPGNLLSLATLTDGTHDTTFGDQLPEYHTIGYFTANDDAMRSKLPVHFTISDGILREVTNDLNKLIAKFTEEKNTAPKKKPLSNTAMLDGDGMAF